MTTSIDPSVDELLLLQENQYHTSNFVLANMKPIGAERKMGQSSKPPVHMNFVPRDIQENNNSFEAPTTMSIYDHFHFSPLDESINAPIMNEYEFSACPSFANYSSSSTTQSPSQQQISISTTQQKFNQSISTRMHTGTIYATQTYPTSRFYPPRYYVRNSFLNICQQTRSTPPLFSAPFQCHRERFQVNSIGRPILRTNLLQGYNFKTRR